MSTPSRKLAKAQEFKKAKDAGSVDIFLFNEIYKAISQLELLGGVIQDNTKSIKILAGRKTPLTKPQEVVSIENTFIRDGYLHILFTDGVLLNVGKVVAKDGEDGEKGDKGDKGERGEQGIKGEKGETGATGKQGLQGIPGIPGKDGKDGNDGKDGLNGRDGQDGISIIDAWMSDGDLVLRLSDNKLLEIKNVKGEKGDPPEHRWKGTKLQFKKPDGIWGELVDLKGENGLGVKNGRNSDYVIRGGLSLSLYDEGSLVDNEIRSIDFVGSNVSVTSSNRRATVTVTSPTFALNDLTDVSVPSPSNGQVLGWVAANNQWEAVAAGTNLTGLGVDNRIMRWDGTDTAQSSGVTLDDSDNITGVNSLSIDTASGVDPTITFTENSVTVSSVYFNTTDNDFVIDCGGTNQGFQLLANNGDLFMEVTTDHDWSMVTPNSTGIRSGNILASTGDADGTPDGSGRILFQTGSTSDSSGVNPTPVGRIDFNCGNPFNQASGNVGPIAFAGSQAGDGATPLNVTFTAGMGGNNPSDGGGSLTFTGGAASNVTTVDGNGGDVNFTVGAMSTGGAGRPGHINLDGSTLENGGTDDYVVRTIATLNATEAAGGSDIIRIHDTNLTNTDITGWDTTLFVDYRIAGTSIFNIDFDGDITANSDTDRTMIFGRARISSITSDAAYFSHFDYSTSANAGFVQLSNGVVGVNAPSGTTGRLQYAGSSEIRWDNTSFAPISNAGNALGTTTLGWNGLHLSTGTAINWVNGDVTLTHASNLLTLAGGDFEVQGRYLGQQGADVASADEITLTQGNYFDITGTTTINHINNTGWTAGSMVVLQFDASVTVTHNAGSPTGTESDILLAGSANFSATANDTLVLIYDGTTFRELARTAI